MTQEHEPSEAANPAAEVAEKLRLLAESDPARAASMVAQLVNVLNSATGGAFSPPPAPEDEVGLRT